MESYNAKNQRKNNLDNDEKRLSAKVEGLENEKMSYADQI